MCICKEKLTFSVDENRNAFHGSYLSGSSGQSGLKKNENSCPVRFSHNRIQGIFPVVNKSHSICGSFSKNQSKFLQTNAMNCDAQGRLISREITAP